MHMEPSSASRIASGDAAQGPEPPTALQAARLQPPRLCPARRLATALVQMSRLQLRLELALAAYWERGAWAPQASTSNRRETWKGCCQQTSQGPLADTLA